MENNITLCITLGKRAEILEKTLKSILSFASFDHIIAINDFGDEKSNEVFKALCPKGQLISLGYRLGHHKAVDEMYQHVKTEYVFHCEDDWFFDKGFEFENYIEFLQTHPDVTLVSFRKISDFYLKEEQKPKLRHIQDRPFSFIRMDDLSARWNGYTFNPHIARFDLWKNIGGFQKFRKEVGISRWFRKRGKYVAYLEEGLCTHLGGNDSVSKSKTRLKLRAIRKKIKAFLLYPLKR